MIQTATTISQGKHLLDLGISYKSSDMYYVFTIYTEDDRFIMNASLEDYEDAIKKDMEAYSELFYCNRTPSEDTSSFPAWSLMALINLCPNAINYAIKDDDYFEECEALISNNSIIGRFALVRESNHSWKCGYYTLNSYVCVAMRGYSAFDAIIKLIEWLFNNYPKTYKNYLNK
jgi:hypothetical protein